MFDSFDKEFRDMEKSMKKSTRVIIALTAVWIIFLIGAVGTALFIAGRFLGVW